MRNEYLAAENRLLKSQIKGRRKHSLWPPLEQRRSSGGKEIESHRPGGVSAARQDSPLVPGMSKTPNPDGPRSCKSQGRRRPEPALAGLPCPQVSPGLDWTAPPSDE